MQRQVNDKVLLVVKLQHQRLEVNSRQSKNNWKAHQTHHSSFFKSSLDESVSTFYRSRRLKNCRKLEQVALSSRSSNKKAALRQPCCPSAGQDDSGTQTFTVSLNQNLNLNLKVKPVTLLFIILFVYYPCSLTGEAIMSMSWPIWQ